MNTEKLKLLEQLQLVEKIAEDLTRGPDRNISAAVFSQARGMRVAAAVLLIKNGLEGVGDEVMLKAAKELIAEAEKVMRDGELLRDGDSVSKVVKRAMP